MKPEEIAVRSATQADQDFLKEIFFVIRAPEFQHAGLVGDQLTAILNQQHRAMRTHYDRVYPDALYVILEYRGAPIGYFAIADIDSLHLIDISILPEFRSQGIGTYQMKALQARAANSCKSMTLTVEIFNPAKRLYERLGFVVYDEAGIYQRMRWEA